MYGIIYLDSPRNIGEQNLVHPNGINIIVLDDELYFSNRYYVSFNTLNLASGAEAVEASSIMWKAKFKEIEKYLSGVDNLIFAYRKQYAMLMSAKYFSKGYMSPKKSFELKHSILNKNGNAISDVNRSGAENAYIMYSLIKKHGFEAITPVNTKINKKKLKNKAVLNKRTDIVISNYKTGFMERQISAILTDFGYDYTLTDGTIHILTEVGDWKFVLNTRPIMLYRRERYNFGGVGEFKLVDNRLYSPIEAIRTIIIRDRKELEKKLSEIDILNLEEFDEFSYMD